MVLADRRKFPKTTFFTRRQDGPGFAGALEQARNKAISRADLPGRSFSFRKETKIKVAFTIILSFFLLAPQRLESKLTVKSPFPYRHLFFHFGACAGSRQKGPPLVCLNGGIMVDTGSEAPDYIFTCQDRYPPYAALGGMRCLLFVRNEAHRRQYQARLACLRKHLKLIQSFTGPLLDIELPEPLYMPCNLTGQAPLKTGIAAFQEQIEDRQVSNEHVRGGIYLNQLSPTIARLVEQFYDLLKENGVSSRVRLSEYRCQARTVLKWHDKASYVELLRNHTDSGLLPAHVPTAMSSSRELPSMTWTRLLELVRRQTGLEGATEFFIKSGMDADGEVNMILNRENFAGKINELADELANKVEKMGRSQQEVWLLVQPRIERCRSENAFPASVGLTYQIHDAGNIERLVVAGHIYEDAEHKTFIGGYLADDLTRHVLNRVGEKKIIALLQLFADQGYCGPINLDAVRNSEGDYIFIYDCNPRLGGAFPGLILQHALRSAGLRAETLLNIGYHGRFVYPDLRAKLAELQGLGLLYSRNRQQGVYLVPSLVRPESFDPVLINMGIDEMRQLVRNGLISSLSDPGQCDLQGVYW